MHAIEGMHLWRGEGTCVVEVPKVHLVERTCLWRGKGMCLVEVPGLHGRQNAGEHSRLALPWHW